jgi:hypothetical protein
VQPCHFNDKLPGFSESDAKTVPLFARNGVVFFLALFLSLSIRPSVGFACLFLSDDCCHITAAKRRAIGKS